MAPRARRLPPSPTEAAAQAAQMAEYDRLVTEQEAAMRPLFADTIHVCSATVSVSEALREKWVIPNFQRGYVWTEEQALAFHRRLMRGLPLGSIVVVRDWRTSSHIILDGQQRLLTLGARATRNGEQVQGHDVRFNLRTLDWQIGPGDDAFTLAELMDHGHVSRHYRDNDAMRIRVHILRDRLRPLEFTMTWAERITPQQAREVLLATNSGGTPMDAATLAALAAAPPDWQGLC